MVRKSQVSKKLKRSHAVDRLSCLPDHILHHIISLLDTKSAVQTSLLARSWKCLWKHVSVLNFHHKSFPNSSSFTNHINRVLSLRCHGIPVNSITFGICGDKWVGAMKAFEKIVKYADSHGGGGALQHLSFSNDTLQFNISEVADIITASHHNESLKTLKLGRFTLEREFDLHFKLLTTLEMFKCRLQPFPAGELFDPFANLPCLNHLKLLHCRLYPCGPRFIISGLQLLDLEIESPFLDGVYEVIAPKLNSLHWWGTSNYGHIPKLDLPALNHANIHFIWQIPYGNAALKENSAFMKFLCGLRNAECLQLHFYKAMNCRGEEPDYFPLNRIKELIGPEAPPFTRLNTLKIQCAGQQKLPSLDYEVMRSFFEGSLSTKPKSVHLELVNDKQR